MTQTGKYSSDVENLAINDGGNSWDRPRTSGELQGFIERRIGLVGELEAVDYEIASV